MIFIGWHGNSVYDTDDKKTLLNTLRRTGNGKLYFSEASVKSIKSIISDVKNPGEREKLSFDMELGSWDKPTGDHGDMVGYIKDNWNKEGSIWPKRIDPVSIGGTKVLNAAGEVIAPPTSLQDKAAHGPLPPSQLWVSKSIPIEWIPQKEYPGPDSAVKSPKEYLKSIWDRCESTDPFVRHNAYPMGGTGHNWNHSDLRAQCIDFYEAWAKAQPELSQDWGFIFGTRNFTRYD